MYMLIIIIVIIIIGFHVPKPHIESVKHWPRQAYLERARLLHPDLGGEAQEFQRVQEVAWCEVCEEKFNSI